MPADWPNERVFRLCRFMVCYIESEVKIHNAVRSTFDELDAWIRGGRYISPTGKAYWLLKSYLRSTTLRDLLIEDFEFASPEVRRILSSVKRDEPLPEDIHLLCEHVVPVGILEEMLREQHRSQRLTPESVLQFHARFYRRCLVTKQEDGRLSKNSMPPDWKPDDGIFARYTIAGFDWASDFA